MSISKLPEICSKTQYNSLSERHDSAQYEVSDSKNYLRNEYKDKRREWC